MLMLFLTSKKKLLVHMNLVTPNALRLGQSGSPNRQTVPVIHNNIAVVAPIASRTVAAVSD